jgi:hypothetical protein
MNPSANPDPNAPVVPGGAGPAFGPQTPAGVPADPAAQPVFDPQSVQIIDTALPRYGLQPTANAAMPEPVPIPVPQATVMPEAVPASAPVAAQPPAPAPVPQAPQAAPAPAGQAQAKQPAPPAKPTSNPNSTQNTLQIAEIRDGIVIMNDGSFRSVVMVKSINFDLMSAQEQEAVEYSYQGFLNSLYFPIQIFVRSQKVDLRPYLEKLDKIRTEHDNMLLALLMEDYIGYMDALSQQTNIMDKKFYVVIPFFPVIDGTNKAVEQSKNFLAGLGGLFKNNEQHVVINEADLENAKTELRNRVQAVLAGLLQCGVQGLPLDTQELIELYYDTYNPDTATRQQLKNFNDLTSDIVTKGAGAAPQAHLQRELQ